MITYSPYVPADAHDCVALWNNTPELGANFPIDLRLWRQNTEQSPQLVRWASLTAKDDTRLVGIIVVKSLKHLSAILVSQKYQRQGIGTALFNRAAAQLNLPETNWTIGQDYNHFFPGVPDVCELALAFFDHLGFEPAGGFAYDLHRDLSNFTIAEPVLAKIAELRAQGVELHECRNDNLSALADHIAGNYSERWLKDTINRLNVETVPNEIIIAERVETGEVIGFAHTYSNRSRYVGPSIYWRPLLGPKYGGLGPIGVANDVRKIGLGLALLSYAIQSVKDRGATQMAIDWTNILDFYAKVGFTPWKKYLLMRQRSSANPTTLE